MSFLATDRLNGTKNKSKQSHFHLEFIQHCIMASALMFILIGFITLVSPTEKSQGSRPRRNVWNQDTDGKCSTYLLAMIILKRKFSDFPNSRGMCGEKKKKKMCFYLLTQQDLLFSTWPFPQTAVFLQCRSCLQLAKCSVSFVRQGKEREKKKNGLPSPSRQKSSE